MNDEPELSAPPAPPCLRCGVPCCLCLLMPWHAHTSSRCGAGPCSHEWDKDEFMLWAAEIRHRAALWRRAHPNVARVLHDNVGTFAFTRPRRYVVELGPVMPYDERVRWAEAIEACPLCGDEDLAQEFDNGFSTCMWLVCSSAETEPDAGHLEVVLCS